MGIMEILFGSDEYPEFISLEKHLEIVNPLIYKIGLVKRGMPVIIVFHDEFDDYLKKGDISYFPNLYQVAFNEFGNEMPYGTAKARTGDPYVWIEERLGEWIDE